MKRLVLTSAALLCALASSPAIAAPQGAPLGDAVRYAQSDRQISASEAKRIALSRVRGGEVVDIRRTGNAYRVRVIARDGRVVDIVVDARTGRVR